MQQTPFIPLMQITSFSFTQTKIDSYTIFSLPLFLSLSIISSLLIITFISVLTLLLFLSLSLSLYYLFFLSLSLSLSFLSFDSFLVLFLVSIFFLIFVNFTIILQRTFCSIKQHLCINLFVLFFFKRLTTVCSLRFLPFPTYFFSSSLGFTLLFPLFQTLLCRNSFKFFLNLKSWIFKRNDSQKGNNFSWMYCILFDMKQYLSYLVHDIPSRRYFLFRER